MLEESVPGVALPRRLLGVHLLPADAPVLGNEDTGSEKSALETTAAEWRRTTAAIGRGLVAVAVQLPLTAGDDGDRHFPGHPALSLF